MDSEKVTLREMLAEIDSGRTFSVEVVSYDKKRKLQNGRVLYYPSARLELAMKEDYRVGSSQNIYNSEHFTRNIRLFSNGRPTSEIRKIHPLFVVRFNSKELLL